MCVHRTVFSFARDLSSFNDNGIWRLSNMSTGETNTAQQGGQEGREEQIHHLLFGFTFVFWLSNPSSLWCTLWHEM